MRWFIMLVCFMVLAGCTVDQEEVSFKQQVIDLGCNLWIDIQPCIKICEDLY